MKIVQQAVVHANKNFFAVTWGLSLGNNRRGESPKCLAMTHECNVAMKKANVTLECIKQGVQRSIDIHQYKALVSPLESSYPCFRKTSWNWAC